MHPQKQHMFNFEKTQKITLFFNFSFSTQNPHFLSILCVVFIKQYLNTFI